MLDLASWNVDDHKKLVDHPETTWEELVNDSEAVGTQSPRTLLVTHYTIIDLNLAALARSLAQVGTCTSLS